MIGKCHFAGFGDVVYRFQRKSKVSAGKVITTVRRRDYLAGTVGIFRAPGAKGGIRLSSSEICTTMGHQRLNTGHHAHRCCVQLRQDIAEETHGHEKTGAIEFLQ